VRQRSRAVQDLVGERGADAHAMPLIDNGQGEFCNFGSIRVAHVTAAGNDRSVALADRHDCLTVDVVNRDHPLEHLR
jgi:hypothetical protein